MEKKYVAHKALLVNEEGKILLIRDAGVDDHANLKGKWDVPGGRMEKGETPAAALMREVFEETGIEIDPRHAQPVHVDLWGVEGDVQNEPIIGIFYLVYVNNPEVRISEEHTEMFWYDPATPFPKEIKGPVVAAMKACSGCECCKKN